ncbi:MAG TPA: GNAT family N-acetyltransferase [Aquaticitalea sp.]|nr:GNAT family N-acetyltransferase [Aquaticitalea sp.]HNU60412.1 GNAT family N-acetyltransferase [Aquaticitalea sp.]
MKEVQSGIFFSADRKDMDVDTIFRFIKQSYWGKSRTFEEQQKALANTLNFGLFNNGKQIAFARVLTDHVFFAYLMDVFVLEPYRGNGYSKLLINEIMAHEPIKYIDKWMLATIDAHSLYSKFGFGTIKNPSRIMEKLSDRAKEIHQ